MRMPKHNWRTCHGVRIRQDNRATTHTPHTHVYIYIYIYTYVCMYIYIYIHAYIHTCIHVYSGICSYLRAGHTKWQTNEQTPFLTHTHARTRTYTHTNKRIFDRAHARPHAHAIAHANANALIVHHARSQSNCQWPQTMNNTDAKLLVLTAEGKLQSNIVCLAKLKDRNNLQHLSRLLMNPARLPTPCAQTRYIAAPLPRLFSEFLFSKSLLATVRSQLASRKPLGRIGG